MYNLKKLSFALVSLFLINVAFAGGNSETKKEEKRISPDKAEKNGDWFIYIDDAFAESKKTGKPIMANFTGSDWCGWCIRLKKEVFNKEEFKAWAKENVVLLELDYPRRTQLPEDLKAQNASLQQAFRVSGYPTIWFFDLNFNKDTKQYGIEAIGKSGYVAGGPAKWTGAADKVLSQRPKK